MNNKSIIDSVYNNLCKNCQKIVFDYLRDNAKEPEELEKDNID